MKKSVLLVPVVCALALISACDEKNHPPGSFVKPRLSENTSKKPEPVANWISLERDICSIEFSDQATSSFEILCPTEVARLALGGVISYSSLRFKGPSINGGGPVDISLEIQIDSSRVAGYIFGKEISIELLMKNGRREVLVIKNEKSDAQKVLEAKLAQEQDELKQEFEQLAGEVNRRFEALKESGGAHKGQTNDDYLTYEGELLLVNQDGEDVYKLHGLGRVVDKTGTSVITQFYYGNNDLPSLGYLKNPNPKSGGECVGLFLDLKNQKGNVCVKNGKYFRTES